LATEGENAGEVPTRTEMLDTVGMPATDMLDTEGWKWEPSEDGGTLTLKDCYIQSSSTQTLMMEKKIHLVLYGENTLETTSTSFAAMISNTSHTNRNAIELTVSAGDESGSLNLVCATPSTTGNNPYGLAGKSLEIQSGNVYCNMNLCTISDDVIVKGGSLVVDCADTTSDGIYTNSGDVTISGGTVNVNAGREGIFVPGINTDGQKESVNILGGDVTINAPEGDGILAKNIVVSTEEKVSVHGKDSALRIRKDGGKIEINKIGEGSSFTADEDGKYSVFYPSESTDTMTVTIAGADYSGVDAAIEKANGLNREDYKDFSGVEAAVGAVVEGKNLFEQETVNGYAQAIYDAIDALESKPAVEKSVIRKVQKWGYNAVKITWDPVEGADGYRLYYKEQTGPWKYVTQIANGQTTSYVHEGLVTGRTYTYYMRAYKVIDGQKVFGAYSDGVSGKALPRQVQITKAAGASKSVVLNWGRINGASGYRVYYKTSENGAWQYVAQIGKGGTTTYTHKNLKKGQKVYYKMRAYRTVDGEKVFGDYSAVKSATVR
ncbi:MAG: hypothetical protein ACLSEX_15445, partial [Blautia sp.]